MYQISQQCTFRITGRPTRTHNTRKQLRAACCGPVDFNTQTSESTAGKAVVVLPGDNPAAQLIASLPSVLVLFIESNIFVIIDCGLHGQIL